MALLEDLIPAAQQFTAASQPIDEPREVKWPPMSLEELTALKLVTQDAGNTESWLLSSGWSMRWDDYDRLYLFRVPIAYWEGTAVPRASLGVPVVYEHIASILPQIMTGLFQDEPPFLSKPRPGTSMEAARANDAVLSWELQRANFREEIRRGAKNTLLYGTGIWKWGWRQYERKRIEFRPKTRPVERRDGDSVIIEHVDADEFEPVEVSEEVNEPTFEAVNLRNVLVDPSLRVPDIRQAKFVIHKIYLTAQQLDQLREQPGYKIPTREQLVKLFMPPKEAALENPLAGSPIDTAQEFAASESTDSTIDPLAQPLEALEYWTADRVITVLQRKLVIRNESNEWGEIPFCSAVYDDIPASFYGMGIAKLVGGEQRLQQGSINAFLDDLALALNGMFVRVRGSNVPTTQIRMRPGGVLDVDVENGIAMLPRTPLPTADVMAVVAASDQRAQRRTAANELVVQGGLPAQRSSATRTATGIQFIAGGAGIRLQFFVENLAAQVFVPTLAAFKRMSARKLRPSQLQRLLSKELGEAYQGNVKDVVNAELDFEILAAAKLQSRRAMAQSLPILLQTLFSEPVMASLRQEGKKVNVSELIKMLYDVSGWPNRQDVIVPFDEEDQLREVANNPLVQKFIEAQVQSQARRGETLEKIEEENVARMARDAVKSSFKMAEAEARPTRTPLETR